MPRCSSSLPWCSTTGRPADVAAACGLATLITLLLAAPVLLTPSERLFGMETVGRHHDPFTSMSHFAAPATGGAYAQPVTDGPGRWFARLFGSVAGYNLMVLITFPLSAAAAYLLARQLAIAPAFALIAALAFAFAPFHLAHAAYHVHVAQTQWIALYLLALWRALDRGTGRALTLLAGAVAGVTLSNFYGGLVAAVVTPVAAVGYFAVRDKDETRKRWHLVLVSITLGVVAAGGIAFAWWTGHPAVARPATFGYPAADVLAYSARWWSYLVPPLAHPLAGGISASIFADAGIREGRLEQQLTLGWGFLALAAAAVVGWFRNPRAASVRIVPVLAAVAALAFVCSLAGGPSSILHQALPMFRSYARFGVVVQLMTVLLAAIGAQRLWTSDRVPFRVACAVLVGIGAAEYVASPLSLSRDVLPTSAHRWVVAQPGAVRALDCAPLTVESGSVDWLSQQRISMRSAAFDDCTAPDLAGRLAAGGYTHAIVRQRTLDARWIRTVGTPAGLVTVARFRDGEVFAITASPARVYTARVSGFYRREYEGTRTWQWMGDAANWDVINNSGRVVVAALHVELAAIRKPRRVRVTLDGQQPQVIHVLAERRTTVVRSLILAPGRNTLRFEPLDAPELPAGGERRPLSVAFGGWQWRVIEAPR